MTSLARPHPAVYTCQSGILINWPASNLDPQLFTNEVVEISKDNTYCVYAFGSIQTEKVFNCLFIIILLSYSFAF
jgi:hypothetical protein